MTTQALPEATSSPHRHVYSDCNILGDKAEKPIETKFVPDRSKRGGWVPKILHRSHRVYDPQCSKVKKTLGCRLTS
jgi:hypothetical protein